MSDERKFDPAWPHGHVTRDGRKARILATDLKGPIPIVAAVEERGIESAFSFASNGSWAAAPSNVDLFNAPAPKLNLALAQNTEDG